MRINMNNLRRQAVKSYNELIEYILYNRENNNPDISNISISEIEPFVSSIQSFIGTLCCISDNEDELFVEIDCDLKNLIEEERYETL